jgi:hypothetical protein
MVFAEAREGGRFQFHDRLVIRQACHEFATLYLLKTKLRGRAKVVVRRD